jgi:hypothetical protein
MDSSLAIVALVAQLTTAQATPQTRQPPGAAIVCAVKAGQRQSYWSEQAAVADGAMVLYKGECPWPSGGGSNGA